MCALLNNFLKACLQHQCHSNHYCAHQWLGSTRVCGSPFLALSCQILACTSWNT